MKVKLATQVLSKSVADSLAYLNQSENYQHCFKDVLPTIKFVELFNNLFDVMNSHSLYNPHKFKRAISEKNAAEIFSFLNDAAQYIKSLYYLGDRNEKVLK